MRFITAAWLQALDAAHLTNRQRGLLQRLLFALDDNGHLGQNVASVPSVVVAVIRAQAALESHGSTRQPYEDLLGRVVDATIEVVGKAESAYRVAGKATLAAIEMELKAMASQLAPIPTANGKKSKTPTVSSATTEQAARQLDGYIVPLVDAVKSWIPPLWNGSVTGRALTEQMICEVAAVIALEGRDASQLHIDLAALLAHGTPSAAAIKDLLWPPRRRHQVTLVVHGARELRGLDTFVADTSQQKLSAGLVVETWTTSEALQSFLQYIGPLQGPATLVRIATDAPDPGSAARKARRELSEALDHYTAGDRIIDLRLAPEWMVESPPPMGRSMGTAAVPGRNAAYPLIRYIPVALRPAMRAANLARRVDAPMASAALSWSALESTGLPSKQVDVLARACALQTLRRHLASAHTVLLASAHARLDSQRLLVTSEEKSLSRFERAVAHCARSTSPKAQLALAERTMKTEESRLRLKGYQQDLRDIEAVLAQHLPALEAHAPTEGSRQHLRSVDSWLDTLLPSRPMESSSHTAARNAVAALAACSGAAAAESIATWRSRLADPKQLATWLRLQTDTYRSVLEWLYATRNMVIHRGRFSVPSDELTAYAASGIVDMALEFLGNWHALEHACGASETSAVAIYGELADRLTDLVQKLEDGKVTCHPLRVDYISGPNATWWNIGPSQTTP